MWSRFRTDMRADRVQPGMNIAWFSDENDYGNEDAEDAVYGVTEAKIEGRIVTVHMVDIISGFQREIECVNSDIFHAIGVGYSA